MKGILHTAPYDTPFDYERKGGFRNLNIIPLTDAKLPTMLIGPVDKIYNTIVQYMVQLDSSGEIIARTKIEPPTLNIVAEAGLNMAVNDRSNSVDIPCGVYYLEIFFTSDGTENPLLRYKTEVFRVDTLIDETGGDAGLPVVPKLKGDFSPLDFNNDFYTT